MPLINADTFLNNVRTSRTLHAGGRFGGGKTALCSYIALICLRKGWAKYAVSNYPLAIGTFPPPLPLRNSVIVLDEAAEFASRWSDASSYVKNLRKHDLIYLMPSVFPPHNRLRRLTVSRTINGYVFGVPVWVYKWRLNDRDLDDSGMFFWWQPIRDIKGLYSTDYEAESDWGIVHAMEGNKGSKRQPAASKEADMVDEIGASMSDVSSSLDTAVGKIAKAAKRMGRR